MCLPAENEATMNLWQWMTDMLSNIGPLTIALFGLLLALLRYFIQKDNEQNRKRYLDEGFDAMVFQVEEALQVFRHNWSNGLTILRHFRELKGDSDPDICKDRVMELPYKSFTIAPSYRIQLLLNDEDHIIWKIQQRLFSFVKTSTDVLTSDLCTMIRLYVAHKDEYPNPYEAEA